MAKEYVLRNDADGNDAIELGEFETWEKAAEEAFNQLGWNLLVKSTPKKDDGDN